MEVKLLSLKVQRIKIENRIKTIRKTSKVSRVYSLLSIYNLKSV